MDLIVYCCILALVGIVRVGKTQDVPESVGIVSSGATTTVDCELPVGQNLALIKEHGAYTIILEELGLIKC